SRQVRIAWRYHGGASGRAGRWLYQSGEAFAGSSISPRFQRNGRSETAEREADVEIEGPEGRRCASSRRHVFRAAKQNFQDQQVFAQLIHGDVLESSHVLTLHE